MVYNQGAVLLHKGQLKNHGLPHHPKVSSHVFVWAVVTAAAAGTVAGRASKCWSAVGVGGGGWGRSTNDENIVLMDRAAGIKTKDFFA